MMHLKLTTVAKLPLIISLMQGAQKYITKLQLLQLIIKKKWCVKDNCSRPWL